MRRSLLASIVLVAFVAIACSGAATPGPFSPNAQPVPVAGGDSTAGPAPAYDPFGGEDTSGSNAGALRDTAKIIRNGSLALQVADLPKAVAEGQRIAEGLGGFVGASRQENRGDQPSAQITYRIPVDRWDDALTAFRAQAEKVVEESTDSLEVTDQLVDLAARVRNLRASENALLAIAAKTEKISDVLEVQSRLTEVRGEIERLEAQRTSLEDRVAFATLTVTYGLEVAAVREAVKGFDPNTEVDRASAQLIEVVQGVATAGIWFAIVWLPILLVLLIVFFIGVRLARRMGIRPPRPNPGSGWGPPPGPPPSSAPPPASAGPATSPGG